MPVKRKSTQKRKQEPVGAEISELSQLDLPGMSLASLLQLGTGMLLKQAIAAEITDYLGRGHYEHGLDFKDYRNGTQKTRLDTGVGVIEYERPKVTNAPDFKSNFHVSHMRRPEELTSAVTDMYVNGISTRKVKDSLKAVTGERCRLSKSTVSRITKRLRDEFAVWKKRDLSDLNVAYLFLDAIRIGMRVGGTSKDAVLLAYAIMSDGSGARRERSQLGEVYLRHQGPRTEGSAAGLL